MKRKFIPAEESFVEWPKDVKYMAEYQRLTEESALASASIAAKNDEIAE